MAHNKKFGVSGSVSYRESNSAEKNMAIDMDQYLLQCGFYEGEEESITRERVLGKLNFLFKKFVEQVSNSKGLNNCGGEIFTFGSYRLGVHSQGADIDTLCAAPKHVSRLDFFHIFYEELENNGDVTELSKIEEAYVPLIRLKYDGISIDLLFARLNLSVVDSSVNVQNNALLKNMDEKCILSLNGVRLANDILNLIPNTQTFQSALRCIKYWGHKRYVYGHVYGYFGGVAYAITVARICQMYPNASSFMIVKYYFETFAKWKWPLPVILKEIEDYKYNFKVWDPKAYPSDRFHKMPVITPAYPSMCSTHNVITSTQTRFLEELNRSIDIFKENKPVAMILEELFLPSNFFKKYKFFVMVVCYSSAPENFLMWEGLVNSRLRHLAMKLELMENITSIPLFPKSFNMLEHINNKIPFLDKFVPSKALNATINFLALDFSEIKQMISSKKIIINHPVKEFKEYIYDNEKKDDSMSLDIRVLKRKEVGEFFKIFYNDGNGN
ncbi:poly(A) polymerase [Spraguea lophii 42_110]|uniref:Poly(A) polymerase n=1 Tax=Spraguea lophii (strain 42_110) TaxID=1358809 RepID=S7W766_SPRLO|nr:poly(A) polymerase [Spraguea lophii 42_110]